MRFFRIPGFSGIEAHRDDADRGSLRVVEGCLPHGPGGLRSGPVWKKVGDVTNVSTTGKNIITAADDTVGNSAVFVSRAGDVHDLLIISSENTELEQLGQNYNVAIPEDGLYALDDAVITPIGNRLYAVGDGSQEALYTGKGPGNINLNSGVAPDEELYEQEWSRFPSCQFYVQGPKKTIFAAGNPERPLTVYVSEPAGITAPFRDTPYSTEETTYYEGQLSTVEILGSNASKITALSTRGNQVVVHTDKGGHILYAPSMDQADTGYRVEQSPATNFSAAVCTQVVSGEGGSQTYWIGHDGQVYKDEAASRGAEDLRSKGDEDQANWKSKGVWEHELPTDLSDSFATYDAQSGNYFFFVRESSIEQPLPTPVQGPTNIDVHDCDAEEAPNLANRQYEIENFVPVGSLLSGSFKYKNSADGAYGNSITSSFTGGANDSAPITVYVKAMSDDVELTFDGFTFSGDLDLTQILEPANLIGGTYLGTEIGPIIINGTDAKINVNWS